MEGSFNWVPIITAVGANLVTTISLFLWSRAEASQDRRQFYTLIMEIQKEMKDFHGRLVSIEERKR